MGCSAVSKYKKLSESLVLAGRLGTSITGVGNGFRFALLRCLLILLKTLSGEPFTARYLIAF